MRGEPLRRAHTLACIPCGMTYPATHVMYGLSLLGGDDLGGDGLGSLAAQRPACCNVLSCVRHIAADSCVHLPHAQRKHVRGRLLNVNTDDTVDFLDSGRLAAVGEGLQGDKKGTLLTWAGCTTGQQLHVQPATKMHSLN